MPSAGFRGCQSRAAKAVLPPQSTLRKRVHAIQHHTAAAGAIDGRRHARHLVRDRQAEWWPRLRTRLHYKHRRWRQLHHGMAGIEEDQKRALPRACHMAQPNKLRDQRRAATQRCPTPSLTGTVDTVRCMTDAVHSDDVTAAAVPAPRAHWQLELLHETVARLD